MNAEEPARTASELVWFKSSHSSNEGGACVEVAVGARAVYVRDSKDRQGPRLSFSAQAWADFTAFATGRRSVPGPFHRAGPCVR